MYCDQTNTRAVARSTIITDLGRVQYIFSDKTGTLTQNVMRFKRCSVDGMMFGSPIAKTRPGAKESERSEFHPLKRLLVGNIKLPVVSGLQGLGAISGEYEIQMDKKLTMNAEMFCRVLCLCHTVVVEKDLDQKKGKSKNSVATVKKRGIFGGLFGKPQKESADAETMSSKIEKPEEVAPELAIGAKGPDGAPFGFAYQAESPDEGALVSAASRTFGFQVITRDSSGIRVRINSPSHLRDPAVIEGLRNGSKTLLNLAASTASNVNYAEGDLPKNNPDQASEEVWEILAVNKFDSDRKRMSILLRSPTELGSLPMLFCKGADSAMLDRAVCTGLPAEDDEAVIARRAFSERRLGQEDEDEWEVAQTLGLQTHLGDFASEGLRTLVLGMRVLSEDQCATWLEEFKTAATSLKDRDGMLTAAAKKIETELFIVGATAIEDKLQVGVPDTIATLGKAGIKLWVLTGDKRETAVEIGYATHVLTNKMHLTEVPDNGVDHVRTQMSMEFIRLVKMGKLPLFQRSVVDQKDNRSTASFMFSMGKGWRAFKRTMRALFYRMMYTLGIWKVWAGTVLEAIKDEAKAEADVLPERVRMKRVRDRADKIIQDWLKSAEGVKQRQKRPSRLNEPSDDGTSLASEEVPRVFSRAESARHMLSSIKSEGGLSQAEKRSLSLAQVTVTHRSKDDEPLVDEDALSLDSFFPDSKAKTRGDFDRRKRTLLERLFAVDRDVRKGMLMKHMNSQRLATILEEQQNKTQTAPSPADGPRALVIEGAALKHMLGDPDLEEVLFSVARHCDAVIACRVSPKQKALLVNLVRHNVRPEPVTLAIGDGANDVGMIQEAHIGIGISGKEGKQAVNASDFAIAQFRFLEGLVLKHGRWDCMRLSSVVLFSFYKNAVMVGCIVIYCGKTVFSGTPLFDEWVLSVLNFICVVPIIILGLFDRCLSKEYVLKHPEVYTATRNNEVMAMRLRGRWILICFVHVFTIYYMSVLPYEAGGGISTAFVGLMSNSQVVVGDGEVADLKSVGLIAFTNLVLVLGLKVCCCWWLTVHRSILLALTTSGGRCMFAVTGAD
jgi:magnesium-transporting ATPase (P-type)